MALSKPQKSNQLVLFANSLAPAGAFVTTGNQTANTVLNKLRSSSTFDVDRVIITGSMGKRTSFQIDDDDDTEYVSDYDLVVFLNHEDRPSSFFHTKIPKRIAKILRDVSGLEVKAVHFCCVKFTFRGYSFDLVPAINFVPESTPEKRTLQKERTFQAMLRSELHNRFRYSAGLCETYVYFMSTMSSLTHSLVRIAKYWLRNLRVNSFSGMKLLVETVAVDAALVTEKNYSDDQMYYGVREFLRKMKDFRNIHVVITSGCTYYLKDIPGEILNENPLVLDPSNPFNNLVQERYDIDFEAFEEAARWSLSQLDRIGRDDWSSIFTSPEEEDDDDSSASEEDYGYNQNNGYTDYDDDSDGYSEYFIP